MDLAFRRVLIFGIDSFTGEHLSRYLRDVGYVVFGTTKKECDITIKDSISNTLNRIKPNYIINLTAIASPAHNNIIDFYRVNTIGVTNLLDAILESALNISKTILVSSATVYGNQNLDVLDESLSPKPANHYGASKYSMEKLAESYFDRLNIIITRPFNYTGVGQSQNFLIPKIVNHFKDKKEVIELGNLDISREFNDIEFIYRSYKRLLDSSINSEVVNICSGRGVKLLDIIDIMSSIAKYRIEVEVNPKFIRKDEIKSLTGSPQKLFSLIGEVKQKRFEDTLKDMFEAETIN